MLKYGLSLLNLAMVHVLVQRYINNALFKQKHFAVESAIMDLHQQVLVKSQFIPHNISISSSELMEKIGIQLFLFDIFSK